MSAAPCTVGATSPNLPLGRQDGGDRAQDLQLQRRDHIGVALERRPHSVGAFFVGKKDGIYVDIGTNDP